MKNKTIVEQIGVPTILEACAEECSELSQACLKLARKLRGENPTPKTEEELIDSLKEEMGDVLTCMDVILYEAKLITRNDVHAIADFKLKRWYERLDEFFSTTKPRSVDERFNLLNDLPEVNEDILIKMSNPNLLDEKRYLYTVGYYAEDGTWWTAVNDIIPTGLVVGWREIPE